MLVAYLVFMIDISREIVVERKQPKRKCKVQDFSNDIESRGKQTAFVSRMTL